jgi:hypothetical protein
MPKDKVQPIQEPQPDQPMDAPEVSAEPEMSISELEAILGVIMAMLRFERAAIENLQRG